MPEHVFQLHLHKENAHSAYADFLCRDATLTAIEGDWKQNRCSAILNASGNTKESALRKENAHVRRKTESERHLPGTRLAARGQRRRRSPAEAVPAPHPKHPAELLPRPFLRRPRAGAHPSFFRTDRLLRPKEESELCRLHHAPSQVAADEPHPQGNDTGRPRRAHPGRPGRRHFP